MSLKVFYALILFSCFGYSQSVSVDDTNYNATDLANLLLNGSCIETTNVSYSSAESVAYFNNNGSSFPLNEGIIIRSGIANLSAGMYTGNDLSSGINNVNDPDLNTIADEISGQDANITDTAFLEFDFVPISSDFQFDFIFASNEYGQWQCGFSDVFAFLITDLNTNVTTNLAIIPGTTTPVAVTTIRDNTYNPGCTSVNPGLFDTYNVNDPGNSTINMRGYTTVLTAASTLIPENPYRIRLVIGDFNNTQYDSAIFIGSGSFTTTIDLGEDRTLCEGDEFTVTTGLSEIDFSHTWTRNGVPINGATSNTITITEAGNYEVIVTKGTSGCNILGNITVHELTYNTPNDLLHCDTGASNYSYDLTQNNINTLGLDPAIYELSYYESQADIASNSPITTGDLTNFTSAGNDQTIYIKIRNTVSNNTCDAELSFNLSLSEVPTATQPEDIGLCETGNTTTIDLTQQNNDVLNGLSAANHNIYYFLSETDAQNNVNPIGNTIDIPSGSAPTTIWVRLENATNTSCFGTTSFQIIVHPLPEVSTHPDVLECNQYTLPAIDHGTYYSGPNGTGNQYDAGDTIDQSGAYYIFSGPDANGCTNETSFELRFIDEYGITLNYCDQMIIPPPINEVDSNFYTEPGGPNGSGVLIPALTTVTVNADGNLEYQGLGITATGNTDTIYFYAEYNGSFCVELDFPISVYESPEVDEPEDVTTCLNYTLPPLTHGSYDLYSPGDVITSTQTITITNTDDHNTINQHGTPIVFSCSSTSQFVVNIINDPPNVNACGSYTLPSLGVAQHYLEPNGQGSTIPSGTNITINEDGNLFIEALGITIPGNTDNIYVYAEDTENGTNCTSNMYYTLTINPIPPVDTLENGLYCIDTPYELPPLTNGNYYTEPNGAGTQLNAGDLITSTQTIYIYNLVNGCDNESSFHIEIRDLPPADILADVYRCEPYTLLPLNAGNYYTEPNGQGTIVQAGEVITETTTFYIFNAWDDLNTCTNQSTFTVNILGVDVGTIPNVVECDSYALPPLTVGKYYNQPQFYPPKPTDEIPVGTVYNVGNPPPNTIYVYAANEDRIVCESQTTFTISVSQTPSLPNFSNHVVCGSYTLGALDNSAYNVNYYTEPNGTGLISSSNYTLTASGDQPETHTIYVYATAFNNVNCFDETSFTVTVHPLRNITIEGGILCVDPVTNESLTSVLLSSGLNASEYSVDWYLDNNLVHNGVFHNATIPGTYTVEFTKLSPDTPPECNYNSTTVTVEQSSVAIATATLSDYFENNAAVTVNVSGGYGDYVFQLDSNLPQNSHIFDNVSSGDHIINVIDTRADCGVLRLEVTVVNYPRFFTPNNDGVNDTWNVWDLRKQDNAEIYILDRFGKIITQIKPSGKGWDGTYNGKNLFSDDYWFLIKYTNEEGEPREFSAHFTLKR